MQLLEHSCTRVGEDLALDEALLEQAEQSHAQREVLRLWEPASCAVIVGRSSRVSDEVDLAACRAREIPILRRISGGGTVLIGPGCLMYSLILSFNLRPQLRAVDEIHRFVLEQIVESLQPHVANISRNGTSDIALGDRKVSGNSLRVRRNHGLYHGTLMYDLRIESISACLKSPPREPAYRQTRTHADFLTNLPLTAATLRRALIESFDAREPLEIWPRELAANLARDRYESEAWNFQRA